MSRSRRLLLVPLLALAVGLGSVAAGGNDTPAMAVAGAAAVTASEPAPVEDPFPITRVHVAEGQLADALKPFAADTLVRMPRADFEARVRKAALAADDPHTAPRLAEAKYTAALAGANLTGDAEWVVLNPRDRPALLQLDPLRIAIRSPAWADGRDAVVGTFGPGFPAGPGLWVPGGGRHVLRFKWSAAGTGITGDRQFDVRVPPCPAAVLDLTLPADRVPTTAAADVLLTGPTAVPGDDVRQAWRFRFGDRGRLEFGVRGPGDVTAGTAVASLAARYDLTPGSVTCSFEYDFRPPHGRIDEWVFTLPPGLHVTEVGVNDRAGWRVDAAARELRVALRHPSTGGKVQIAAVAPLPPRGAVAPLPVVRPVGAAIADPPADDHPAERLELRVHPDVQLDHLDPADYRLTDATLAPDQVRVLTLVGSLLPPGADHPFRRPPAARVRGGEPDFTTREEVEWRVESGRAYLSARVVARVRRGPLFGLTFRTLPGFKFDRVTTTPEDAAAYAGQTAAPAPTPGVVIEFARPVLTGQQVEVRLDLRGPVLPAAGTLRLPFPRVAPVGAAERDGWVSICPGPGWAVEPYTSPPVAPAAGNVVPDDAPDDATATYLFRGLQPDGELVVAPVRPAFTAAADTRLALAADRLRASTRLVLNVTGGAVPAVVVFEPGRVWEGRTWRAADGSNAIASATPVDLGGLPDALPLLAAPGVGFARLVGVGGATAAGPGTYWVVRFARPVSGELALETAAAVPGVTPTRARQLAGEFFSGRRVALSVCGAASVSSRVEAPPALGGAVTHGPSPAAPEWSFDGLHLVTVCDGPDARVVFGGAVVSRGGAVLPVELPAGAEVRAANVGGFWLDPGKCEPARGEGRAELRLPVPAGTGPVRFEVRYRLPAEVPGVAHRVRSPEPLLPGGRHPVGRWWAFPRGTLAAWPFGLSGQAAELPILLGEPLDRPAGELTVGRFAGEVVTTVPVRSADAVGAGLAALLAAVGWVGAWRRDRSVGFALLAALVGCGVAVQLGPPAWVRAALPPLAAGVVAAAGVVVTRGREFVRPPAAPNPPTPSGARRTATAAAVLVVGLVPLATTRAQPAARDAVLILPGASDPTREVAVVPRAVLDKLDALVQKPRPAAVVTAAAYDGRAEDGAAWFTATFTVQCFRDGETFVPLPLAGVQLESVTVGGKPAHPAAPQPDLYTVAVPGRGRHEVQARFAVPIAATGSEREAKFGVPEVPDTRLTFAAPGAARQLQAVGRLGDRTTTTEKDAVRLAADLGGVRAVQVRWRQGGGGAAVVSAREGCVWDVTEGGSELTACYQVAVESGSVNGLRFDLPAGLEPARVAVKLLNAAAGPGVLAGWSVGPERNGARPLRIDLTGPTEGRLLVTLECVPRGAPTRRPVLRFPRPVGMTRAGAVYGLRATGVAVEGVARVGVTDLPADTLAREFGTVPDLRLKPGVPLPAFAPRPNEAAELRPTLRPGPDLPDATQEVAWRVGPHRADAAGTITWAAKEPVPAVEFGVAARVVEVRGADVSGWAQADGRVQVWLRKPAREGSVQWYGTTAPSAIGKPPPDPLGYEPMIPRLFHAHTTHQTVRVRVADGWAARVDRGRGWTAVPGDPGREWVFRAEGTPTPPRLLLSPARGGPTPAPGPKAAPVAPSLPAVAPTPAPVAPAPPVAPAVTPAPAVPAPGARLSVLSAAAWCGAVLAVGGLFARFPRSTWPEQVGLLGGLFGFAVAGGWAVGAAGYALARVGWLFDRVKAWRARAAV